MDILLSLLTGGATGIVGTALSAGFNYFGSRQKNKQEIELRKLELQEMRQEAAIAERVTAMELEAATTQAEYAGLQASYREASTRWTAGAELTPAQTWLMVVVDVVRGLMRPMITVVLMGYVGWIYAETLADPSSPVVSTVLYLTTASVLWWFGSRQTEKALGK